MTSIRTKLLDAAYYVKTTRPETKLVLISLLTWYNKNQFSDIPTEELEGLSGCNLDTVNKELRVLRDSWKVINWTLSIDGGKHYTFDLDKIKQLRWEYYESPAWDKVQEDMGKEYEEMLANES